MNIYTLLNYLFRNIKRYLVIVLLSGGMIVISTIYIPEYLGICFQQIIDYKIINDMKPLYIFMLCYFIRAAAKLIRNHFAAYLGTHIVKRIRLLAIKKVFHHKDMLKQQDSTKLFSILTYDLDLFSQVISWRTFLFIEEFLILTFALINMAKMNWHVVLFLFPGIVVLFILSTFYSKHVDSLICKVRDSITEMSRVVFENIGGQKVFRALNVQHIQMKKFHHKNRDNMNIKENLITMEKKYVPLMEFVAYMSILISVLVSSYMVIQGRLTIGYVVTYNGYMWFLLTTVSNLSSLIVFYSNSRESFRRVSKAFNLHCPSPVTDTDLTAIVPKHDTTIHKIDLQDVDYSIHNKQILTHTSMSLTQGTFVVITGGIGVGKTTLSKIIAGTILDYNGSFLINDKALEGNQQIARNYRNHIGYVPQNPVFFNLTLKENILLGRTITNSTFSEIVSMCQLDDLIETLPQKESTLINKDCNFLSGGEKQRISIARALVGQPDILIIDDALTAIDAPTLQPILQMFHQLKKDKIIIIISNLPNLLLFSDQVYDLRDGQLELIHDQEVNSYA